MAAGIYLLKILLPMYLTGFSIRLCTLIKRMSCEQMKASCVLHAPSIQTLTVFLEKLAIFLFHSLNCKYANQWLNQTLNRPTYL